MAAGRCAALWPLVAWSVHVAGLCLLQEPSENGKQLMYKGLSYPLRLGYGMHASPGPLSEVLRILLEEKLEIEAETISFPSSAELLKSVIGCNGSCESQYLQDPPNQAWVAIEVWLTTAEEQYLSESDRLDVLGLMGYKCLPGIYTQVNVINAGTQAGFDLKWWETYHVSRQADQFFSKVTDLDAAIRNMTITSSLSYFVCGASFCDRGSIRPMCDSAEPLSVEYMILMRDHNLTCNHGWWYSPACSSNITRCIPVLLGVAAWNMIAHCRTFRDLDLPFAVTWLGWGQLMQAVYELTSEAFLFYWWEPDTSFMRLHPSRPEHIWFNDRDMRISQLQNTVKVSWTGLRDLDTPDTSNDLLDFLRKVSFRDSDLQAMLSLKVDGLNNTEAACSWLLDNEAHWKDWLPANRTIVYVQSDGATESDNSGVTIGIVVAVTVTCLALIIAAWCICARSRSGRTKANSPLDDGTPFGAWVCKWVGPHVWQELQEDRGNGIVVLQGDDVWVVANASPFCISIESHHCPTTPDKNVSEIPDLQAAISFMSQGTFKDESYIKPCSACKFPGDLKKPFTIKVENHPDWDVGWMKLSQSVSFTIGVDEWSSRPTERDFQEGSKFSYSDEVVRKSLLFGRDGHKVGEIKLTRAGALGNLLLINWSPSHELRGMPLEEFFDFLDEVVEDPKHWECKVPTTGAGQKASWMLILKGPAHSNCKGDELAPPRNMYDACEHIIMRNVAPLDASYAELRTHFYPANIFISHVWGQPAERTRQALRNVQATLETRLQVLDISMKSKWSCEPPGRAMVWFCTLCNNQTRIGEELGHNVWESPFARVLKSEVVQATVMIAPFDALSRKWCNFEFGLSHKECKPLLMLEPSGLVQAGEVAPKDLVQIACKLQDFDCEKAACTNPDDVKFIDQAVKELFGGYASLNDDVRGVFTQAIRNAHQHTADALHRLKRDPEERPGLKRADSFHTYAAKFLGALNEVDPANNGTDDVSTTLPGAVHG